MFRPPSSRNDETNASGGWITWVIPIVPIPMALWANAIARHPEAIQAGSSHLRPVRRIFAYQAHPLSERGPTISDWAMVSGCSVDLASLCNLGTRMRRLTSMTTYSYNPRMQGFDPKFRDLPDYIIGVTREIWEDRGLATLRAYYADDIPVRSPSGVVVGNEAVIAATLATLAEFPDRQLFAEDVIWSGDEVSGFLSSHRIISTATHGAEGVFGPATGKRLRYRVVADCAAKDNQIYDEWLIRDQGAIVRQLGIHPKQFAADEIDRQGGPDQAKRPFTPETDQRGRYSGTGNDNEWGQRYESLLVALMAGDIAAVERDYDRAVNLEHPGGMTGVGWSDAERFWLRLRSSFPSATFRVDHRIGRHDEHLSPRAALRWSLSGSHDGWGAFGAPTGAPVHIMGINHAEYGPWGLRREYVLIDETAIWKQILLHTG